MQGGGDGDGAGEHALDEPQPLPPVEAAAAIEAEQTQRKHAGKGARNGVGRPEERVAECHVAPREELAQVESRAGDEAGLAHGQQEAQGEKGGAGADEQLAPRHGTPAEHEDREQTVGADALDRHVGRDLKQDHAEREERLAEVDVGLRQACDGAEVVRECVACR